MMNILPNYFGVTYYPKIMGFVRIFWAIVGGIGAPIAGYVYDTTGSYLPAFKGTIAIFAIGLGCLVLARPPVHPSLKAAHPKDSQAA
jgi:hydrogenase/urease accessory protein HupE